MDAVESLRFAHRYQKKVTVHLHVGRRTLIVAFEGDEQVIKTFVMCRGRPYSG